MQPMTLAKKLTFSAVACLLFLLIMGAVLELTAWLAGYPAAPTKYQKGLWLADAELGWVCRPSARFHYLASPGWVAGTTDACGYRPTLGGSDDPRGATVLCLGDSTTFSAECPDERTWPEAASRETARRGRKVAFVNRGVGGYSTVQALLTLRRTLGNGSLGRRPAAVVYHFAFNDPTDNFVCDEEMPKPYLTAAPAAATQPAAWSFALQPGRAWEIPSSSPSAWIKSNLRCYSMLRSWTRRRSPEAFADAARDILTHMDGPCQALAQPTMEQAGVRYVLGLMKKECDELGVPLFVSFYNIPLWDDNPQARREVEQLLGLDARAAEANRTAYHAACDALGRIAADCGARFIDTRNTLAGMPCHEWAASPNDAHLSPAANEKIGAHIADAVDKALNEPGSREAGHASTVRTSLDH